MPALDPNAPRPPGAKVLIVDDEPHLRALVEHTLEELESEGIELLTAADGEEALAVVAAERPALVILDVMMPRLNGLDACRAIRQHHPGVLVIMLTAKGQDLDRSLGPAVGADHYATKPFDPDELLATARRLLGIEAPGR